MIRPLLLNRKSVDCPPCKTRHCIVTLSIAAFAKTALLVTIAKAHFHFLMKKNLGATAT
jgi:hypothetical protein